MEGGNLEMTARKRVCASSVGKKHASRVQNQRGTSPSKKEGKTEGEGTEMGTGVDNEGKEGVLSRGRVEE